MSSNNKIPLAKAQKWASRVVEILSQYCDRIEVAGSIRRQAEEVGDIEIVCIPKRDIDMFGTPSGNVKKEFYDAVDKWEAVKGSPDGKYTKRILPNTDGFTVDIFMADGNNWGWILALRTGNNNFNQRILLRAIRDAQCFAEDGNIYDYSDTLNPKLIPMPDEPEFFRRLGLDYIAPENRSLQTF